MTKHEKIQMEIVSACRNIGIEAIQEYRGQDRRADVYIPNKGKPIAFEIQLSPQSLARTLERQEKYIRDGVIGCWLFEKPVPKLIEELNKEQTQVDTHYTWIMKDMNWFKCKEMLVYHLPGYSEINENFRDIKELYIK